MWIWLVAVVYTANSIQFGVFPGMVLCFVDYSLMRYDLSSLYIEMNTKGEPFRIAFGQMWSREVICYCYFENHEVV